MTGMDFRKIWIAAALLALPVLGLIQPASAQRSNYDVKGMNFYMWCQETARIDPARCDKRMPEDEATFEAYRSKIEQYEIPYLQDKQGQISLDNNVLHKDPVDNPVIQDPQRQTSQPQRNPSLDPRTNKP